MDYAAQFNQNRVSWLYAAARSSKLSANAVRVGLLFATFLQPEDRESVSPSYEWLMKNAQLGSRTSLAKALRELEAAGFLRVTRMRRYRSVYELPFTGDAPWRLSPENGL